MWVISIDLSLDYASATKCSAIPSVHKSIFNCQINKKRKKNAFLLSINTLTPEHKPGFTATTHRALEENYIQYTPSTALEGWSIFVCPVKNWPD